MTDETPCAKNSKINHGIALFTKAVEFRLPSQSKVSRDWVTEVDSDELADHRKEYNMIGNKG
jgi:hypothetical protein